MEKMFNSVEEILTDETFLSWYFKSSNEKVDEWNNWLSANSNLQPLVDDAVTIMRQLDVKTSPLSSHRIESAYQRLNSSIENTDGQQPAVVVPMYKSRSWWRIAAAAIVVFAVGFFLWNNSTNHQTSLAANYGETRKHQLPDGTEVMLNANSTVTLGNNWKEGKDREVWLKGEAFFHVTKTSQHDRFIVHADQMDVIVTGTQFNVITRDHQSSVLLTEGSVTIHSKDGKEIFMKPGDFVEMKNDELQKKPANEESILAWKENQLFFEINTPMPEAAKIISEHYGIKVTLADQKTQEGVLSGIMQNDNLDVLISSLEAFGHKITRKDNEIIISTP